jgi:predicted RNA polymerase sigma factor
VAGLLALMLLTDARRAARTSSEGALIPMAEQDRGLWDAAMIAEGATLVTEALRRGPVGPYQLQAAIAALHDQAANVQSTDWPQILALYDMLLALGENPVVRLNHAVALAMVRGPQAGLEELNRLQTDSRIADDHRLHAVRGHLLEQAGEHAQARESYLAAAECATSLPQKRYLHAQAAQCRAPPRW